MKRFSEKQKQRQQQVEFKAEITSASFQLKLISREKEVAERVVDRTGKLYCALQKESQEGRKKIKGGSKVMILGVWGHPGGLLELSGKQVSKKMSKAQKTHSVLEGLFEVFSLPSR